MSKPTDLSEGAIPLRERLTLAESWTEFERAVLPAHVGDLQRSEMRKAFYGGASAMFGCVTGGLDADHEPTMKDLEYLDSLNKELHDFAHSR